MGQNMLLDLIRLSVLVKMLTTLSVLRAVADLLPKLETLTFLFTLEICTMLPWAEKDSEDH